MKKSCSVALAMLLAGTSVGLAASAVPYADDYEGYAVGSNLVGTVWQGAAGQAMAVVTNGTPPAPGVGYPLPSSAHSQILSFSDGPITNEFDGTTSNVTFVALDTMIQPVFAETPDGSQMAAISNSQMSLYISTNGLINAYHGILNSDLPGTPDSTQWSVLSNSPALTSGSWCRLTVVLNYRQSDGCVFYKVGLNGTFISSPNGYTDPDLVTTYPNPKNGPWLCAAKWSDYRLKSVVLNGSGKLDDMVVATNEVSFTAQYATNNTPISWMQQQGLNTNETYPTWDDVAMSDTDGDGVKAWAEYIAGTQPTNENSKLVIVSAAFSNGLPILKWVGTTNAINPYIIQWTSNLLSISSWATITGGLQRTEGTNEVTLPAPPVSPAFLRVNVTTNAP